MEQIIAPIFLDSGSAIEIIWQPQSSLKEKGNRRIENNDFFFKNISIHFHISSTRVIKVCLKKSDSWAMKLGNFLFTKAMKFIFGLNCIY